MPPPLPKTTEKIYRFSRAAAFKKGAVALLGALSVAVGCGPSRPPRQATPSVAMADDAQPESKCAGAECEAIYPYTICRACKVCCHPGQRAYCENGKAVGSTCTQQPTCECK